MILAMKLEIKQDRLSGFEEIKFTVESSLVLDKFYLGTVKVPYSTPTGSSGNLGLPNGLVF